MKPLEKLLRNQLERTIKEARDIAESAARASLEQLGVGEPSPYAHFSDEERQLRRRLRAHGRQLGNGRDEKGRQELDRLIEEVAYEHWHRMLFARFLAENNLLMYPDPDDPVPISLEECEDLAADEGAANGWELAARYAARMLPQIFRPDSPVFQLVLPPEYQQKLERLIADLDQEVFIASDSLGWVYQFWQAKRKEEVNASEVKIGARELPAVTQLFTEPYMVSFLLDNSLGAWWASMCDAGRGRRGDGEKGRRGDAEMVGDEGGVKGIFERAKSEEEIRQACAIPGVPLTYLRFVKSPYLPEKDADAGAFPTSLGRETGASTSPSPFERGAEDSMFSSPSGGKADALIFPSPPGRKADARIFPSPFGRGVRGEGKKTTIPPDILKNARKLRKNLTDVEQLLWRLLRDRLFANKKFRRQHPFGRYILDFYCHELKLAIELDGGQHNKSLKQKYDEQRTRYLEEQGIRVVRFWNNDVLQQTESVLQALWQEVHLPSPQPLSQGERGLEEAALSQGERGLEKAGLSKGESDLEEETFVWQPAAGNFDGWPEQLSELKILDPCCGSGHFLVAVFLMLVPMRMEREGLSVREAIDRVLAENIHGLEIDQRCVQLAAFALALTAWKYPDAGGYRVLPELNVACSGLSVSVAKDEWKAIARTLPDKTYLPIALDWMYEAFKDAPSLGSLLDPTRARVAGLVRWNEIGPAIKEVLAQGQSDTIQEAAVVAHGLSKAAMLLAGKYHWVITNVPYLARGKQDKRLRDFCEKYYPTAKNDLATVFLDRCLELAMPLSPSGRKAGGEQSLPSSTGKGVGSEQSLPSPSGRGVGSEQSLPSPSGRGVGGEGKSGGTVSVVLPQNWLFLTSYKKFREKLLKNDTWHFIARLGPGAFETISGEVVKAILLTMSRGVPEYGDTGIRGHGDTETRGKGDTETRRHGDLFSTELPLFPSPHLIHGLDVSEPRTAAEKAALLRGSPLPGSPLPQGEGLGVSKGSPLPLGEGLGVRSVGIKSVEQAKQLENPDARITLEYESRMAFLYSYSKGLVGIQTGDDSRYVLAFWEMSVHNNDWEFMQATPEKHSEFAGQSWMIRWENGKGDLQLSKGARIQGIEAVTKKGIAMHRMGTLHPYYYLGNYYHQNIATIIPKDQSNLSAIWCFCSSLQYNEAVRRIDQKLNVTNATLVKVPFDLDQWTKIANEKYPNGLPKPYSDDPTQWIFHGHPCGSVLWDESTKWTTHGPLRTDDTVLQIAVARLLGYRWPAEFDAQTRRKQDTENTPMPHVSPSPCPRVPVSQHPPVPPSARHRVTVSPRPSIPASPCLELSDESRFWVDKAKELEKLADEDGIVCIPPVRGEASASDRLLNLLAAAYGDAWGSDTLAQLLKNSDHANKTLETWLRDKFFTQHCKLFHHRPFICNIWDGLRDGFAALVNYHKLNYKNLETLIYTYLGDWINRQKQDIKNNVDGAQERLAAAESLTKKLELILEGEKPSDIFVRWKPIDKQPIGWNPDLNDGVRLNIRPFMTVPGVVKKGAGVLRDKPNINWNKDRGKDVSSAPWFPVFGGDRINDYHLSLSDKQAALKKVKHE